MLNSLRMLAPDASHTLLMQFTPADGQPVCITTCFDDSYVNPLSARFNNLNFYPLEVVSRYREPQLQVAEN